MIKLSDFADLFEGSSVIAFIWGIHSLEWVNEFTKLGFTIIIGSLTIIHLLSKKRKR